MKKIIFIFAILIIGTGCNWQDEVRDYAKPHIILKKKYDSTLDYKYKYLVTDNDVDGEKFFLLTNQNFNVKDTLYITNKKPQ